MEPEIKELNRLTTILLDIFEDQLDIGKLTMMADAEHLLDRQLANLNRPVLRQGGKVKSSTAKQHAFHEYEKFNAKRRALRQADADANLSALKDQEKVLAKIRKRRE